MPDLIACLILLCSSTLQVQCSSLLKETRRFTHMSKSIAAVVGGAAGALAFMAIVLGLLWLCKSQSKNYQNKNSETGSSDPSALGKVST